MKYQFLKWQSIFFLVRKGLLFSITDKTSTKLDTGSVFELPDSVLFFVMSVLLITVLVFCVGFLFSLSSFCVLCLMLPLSLYWPCLYIVLSWLPHQKMIFSTVYYSAIYHCRVKYVSFWRIFFFNCLSSFFGQQLSSVLKITVRDKSARITYELWNINSIRWWCCNIATDEWEVDYWKSVVVVQLFLILIHC
jgi:hypothetical protein